MLLVVVDDRTAVRTGVLEPALVAEAAAEGRAERVSVAVFLDVLDAEEDKLSMTGFPTRSLGPTGNTSITSFDTMPCSVNSTRLRRSIAFVHI